MLGIGAEELILVLIVALLVLGPERLPKVARDVGRVVGDLRRTSDEFREEFLQADKFLERTASSTPPPPPPPEPASLPGGAAPAPAEPATAADPNETAFDREMREARERLAAAREKPAT